MLDFRIRIRSVGDIFRLFLVLGNYLVRGRRCWRPKIGHLPNPFQITPNSVFSQRPWRQLWNQQFSYVASAEIGPFSLILFTPIFFLTLSFSPRNNMSHPSAQEPIQHNFLFHTTLQATVPCENGGMMTNQCESPLESLFIRCKLSGKSLRVTKTVLVLCGNRLPLWLPHCSLSQ